MTARDELAATVRPVLADYGAWGTVPPEHPLGLPSWGDRLWADESDCPESVADALIAAGWRKMPSREALARWAHVRFNEFGFGSPQQVWDEMEAHEKVEWYREADAILALMDGNENE